MTVVKVGGEAYLRTGRNATGCILWRSSARLLQHEDTKYYIEYDDV